MSLFLHVSTTTKHSERSVLKQNAMLANPTLEKNVMTQFLHVSTTAKHTERIFFTARPRMVLQVLCSLPALCLQS